MYLTITMHHLYFTDLTACHASCLIEILLGCDLKLYLASE